MCPIDFATFLVDENCVTLLGGTHAIAIATMLCIVPDKADAAGMPDSLLKRDLTRFLVRSKSKYDVRRVDSTYARTRECVTGIGIYLCVCVCVCM